MSTGKPSGPISYRPLARLSDIWAAWRDGNACIPPLPAATDAADTRHRTTPYLEIRNYHFLAWVEHERHRMLTDLADTYRMRTEVRQQIVAAEERASLDQQAMETARNLRVQEARLYETITTSERILCARVRQLHEHSLRRCATYLRHIVHHHADGNAVLPYLEIALPSLPDWVQSVSPDSRREVTKAVVGAAPSAARLLAAAARLLPSADRAQYAEEFRSELWEIAHAGGRRRAQLAYAARQVMSAWRLRAELKGPRRRGAAS